MKDIAENVVEGNYDLKIIVNGVDITESVNGLRYPSERIGYALLEWASDELDIEVDF